MSIGDKIKEARLASNMTQAALAKKLGVAYQNIGQWESGKRNPKTETLVKIGKVLGVSWTWFLDYQLCSDDISAARQEYADVLAENESFELVKKIISLYFGAEEIKTRKINFENGQLDVEYFLYHSKDGNIALFEDELYKISDIAVDLIKSLVKNISISEQEAEFECKRLETQKEFFHFEFKE